MLARPALLVSGRVEPWVSLRDTGFRRAPALLFAARRPADRARLPGEPRQRLKRSLFPSPGDLEGDMTRLTVHAPVSKGFFTPTTTRSCVDRSLTVRTSCAPAAENKASTSLDWS